MSGPSRTARGALLSSAARAARTILVARVARAAGDQQVCKAPAPARLLLVLLIWSLLLGRGLVHQAVGQALPGVAGSSGPSAPAAAAPHPGEVIGASPPAARPAAPAPRRPALPPAPAAPGVEVSVALPAAAV